MCDKNHTLGVTGVMAGVLRLPYYMVMKGGDAGVPDIQALYAPISTPKNRPGKLAPIFDVLA